MTSYVQSLEWFLEKSYQDERVSGALAAALLGRLPSMPRILSIGPGNGRKERYICESLERKGYTPVVDMIEPKPTQRKLLQDTFHDGKYVGKISEEPFPSGNNIGYDALLAVHSLYEFPLENNIVPAFSEFPQVLRQGGTIAVVVEKEGNDLQKLKRAVTGDEGLNETIIRQSFEHTGIPYQREEECILALPLGKEQRTNPADHFGFLFSQGINDDSISSNLETALKREAPRLPQLMDCSDVLYIGTAPMTVPEAQVTPEDVQKRSVHGLVQAYEERIKDLWRNAEELRAVGVDVNTDTLRDYPSIAAYTRHVAGKLHNQYVERWFAGERTWRGYDSLERIATELHARPYFFTGKNARQEYDAAFDALQEIAPIGNQKARDRSFLSIYMALSPAPGVGAAMGQWAGGSEMSWVAPFIASASFLTLSSPFLFSMCQPHYSLNPHQAKPARYLDDALAGRLEVKYDN